MLPDVGPMLASVAPILPLSCPYIDPMFAYIGLRNANPHSSEKSRRWGGGGDGVATGSPQAGSAAGRHASITFGYQPKAARIFWMTSITIRLWFVVVIVLVVMALAGYLINEIRGLRKSLYSWRDLCNDMDSDDREVRRRAMRRFQRSRRMMTPSTCEATEAERGGFLAETGGVWTDRGPMNQKNKIPLRVDVLRSIGQHMQPDTRESTIFISAFSELNPGDRETMNECLVNMLCLMNSGDEDLARQSFMSMGVILQKIGARTMPFGSPEAEGDEEEDSEHDAEQDEDRRQLYLHSTMDEVPDVDYGMSLHHHEGEDDSDDPMEVEEESEIDHGPPAIDWASANANQRMDHEREVGEYRRRVVRRLNLRADRAEELSNHEGAARLRMQADNLDYL